MSTHPFKDSKWDALPHVVMTSPREWDPSVLDLDLEAEENWFDHVNAVEQDPFHNTFDHFGWYRRCCKAGHTADNHDFFCNSHEAEAPGVHGEPFHDAVQGPQMTFYSAHPTE